jgi:hypothetical protein
MLNAITGQRERRGLQGAASAMRLHSLGSCGQGARVVAGPGVTGAPWPAARQPGAGQQMPRPALPSRSSIAPLLLGGTSPKRSWELIRRICVVAPGAASS